MEITQQTITMVINGIFAFFVVMGFLFGAGRGLKKSTVRLAFVISIAVIMYFTAPFISAWLLAYDFSSLLNDVTINIGGTPHAFTTVNELLTAFIESNAGLNAFVDANPSFTSLVDQLPTIVTNLVVFLFGFWLLKVLTWPIYAITARNYNKRKQDGTKPKKRGLAGGFIGAVQGVVIALVFFMPVAGVSSMLNVEGADGSGTTLLGSFIPQEFADYLPTYENSMVGMVGNLGGLHNSMFDGLTTVKVRDKDTGEVLAVIRPRQEAVTGMQIANDIQLLINMVEGIENGTVNKVDWDLVEDLVDKVFDLNTIELLLEQYAPYMLDEATSNAEYGVSDQIDELPVSADVRAFLDEFLGSFDEATIAGFKSDVMAIVNIGRALDEHGIVDLLFQILREEIVADDLAEEALVIFGTDRELSNDIVVAILGSNSVRTLMPEALNVALGYIEYIANEGRLPEDEDFEEVYRIDAGTINWDIEAEFLTDIMYNLLSFVYSLDPFNMGDVDEIELINSLELSKLGEVVNIVRSTQLFGDIYTSIIKAILAMPQVVDAAGAYVNFEDFEDVLNTTDWVNEFNTVEQMIDLYVLIEQNGELTATQIEDVIEGLDSELLELVIDGIIRAVFIEGFGENIGSVVEGEFIFESEFAWLGDLELSAISANANFFAEVIDFAFNVANNGVENLTNAQIDVLVAAVEGVNTSLDPAELEQFKGFFNELMHYALTKMDSSFIWAQDIDIDDFIDNVNIMGELFKLGIAINDDTFVNYTPAQVDSLALAIADLDNMSPELVSVLQGFYDDIMTNTSPILVSMDLSLIDWGIESDIIEDMINLYLDYEDAGIFNDTLATTIVGKLDDSYIAEQILNAAIEQIVDEETAPTWIASADMTWVTNNSGLVVELAELGLWSNNNDMEDITQAQINALQAEVDLIATSTQELTDFKAYMQTFIDSINPTL
jgi:hypothetical protein